MTGDAHERLINLDYAASTPLRPEAIEALASYDASDIAGANPNSLHTLGRRAATALEGARRAVARSLGTRVRPAEVIFTGGGTESDALALFGIAEGVRARDPKRRRVITSTIEHDAILDNLPALRARGFEVALVRATREGILDLDELKELLDTDVALVSIMFANNETGALMPIKEVARLAHAVGARVHTDAIQGYLHVPIDVDELGVDALSLAGHKVGATVASGALYLRHQTPFTPLVRGGGQEAGRRAGTQDVRAALGLAAVARALAPRVADDAVRIGNLGSELYARLCTIPGVHPTIERIEDLSHLPGIVSVYVEGFESDELLLALDVRGYCVSAGSACSSGSSGPSHVLRAMGLDDAAARGALRISFDDRVHPADLEGFACALSELVTGGAA